MNAVILESLESRTLFSANLAGELVGTLPQTLLPASSDHVSVSIANSGDAPAKGSVGVSFYLSPADAIGDQSVWVGSAARRLNVKPGQSKQLNLKFKLPATLDDGEYFLGARLSGLATQDIADATPVNVQPAIDSLVGSFASAPITVGLDPAGDPGIGAVTLRATNPTAATVHGTITANLFLGTGSQFDRSDPLVGILSAPGATIKPGKSARIPGLLTIPANTPFNTYELLAILKNIPAGASNASVFASQPITVAPGTNPSIDQSGDDTGILDTGSEGTPINIPGAGQAPPTTQTNSAPTTTPTTQPTTTPTQPATGGGGSSCDNGSTTPTDTSSDSSGSDTGSTDDGSTAPTDTSSDTGNDNSNTDNGGDDGSSTASTDSGNDSSTGDSGTGDSGTDNSGDTTTDNGDDGSDDSGDTTSDDGSDDSGDTTTDDSGDDFLKRVTPKPTTPAPVHATSTIQVASTKK